AGVDSLLGEEPIDRTADDVAAPGASPLTGGTAAKRQAIKTAARPAAAAAARTPAQPAVPPPPEVAVMAAREAAAAAQTLGELCALLEGFQGCALRTTATRLVFADGNPDGRIMFVGEAPGYEEDVSGRAFVGRSGKLLDRMMEAIGLDRSKAYVA